MAHQHSKKFTYRTLGSLCGSCQGKAVVRNISTGSSRMRSMRARTSCLKYQRNWQASWKGRTKPAFRMLANVPSLHPRRVRASIGSMTSTLSFRTAAACSAVMRDRHDRSPRPEGGSPRAGLSHRLPRSVGGGRNVANGEVIEPAWLAAWRRGTTAQRCPAQPPAQPRVAPVQGVGGGKHEASAVAPAPPRPNEYGFAAPAWKARAWDGGKRREPVLDLDCKPPRVVRRVGWRVCMRCAAPFWSDDVVRVRMCDDCKLPPRGRRRTP
ncbi:hypothetical protein SAMN05877831_1051 [Rhodobacter maris]|uniref:Uncharacterized protein n=1 Tax=Rhodobacter maris TaxID=446682 RepID=A0A285SER2_9RHOB|nr:hypothetical protein SAMN05877831_1051 [Rhodobacter maris]